MDCYGIVTWNILCKNIFIVESYNIYILFFSGMFRSILNPMWLYCIHSCQQCIRVFFCSNFHLYLLEFSFLMSAILTEVRWNLSVDANLDFSDGNWSWAFFPYWSSVICLLRTVCLLHELIYWFEYFISCLSFRALCVLCPIYSP